MRRIAWPIGAAILLGGSGFLFYRGEKIGFFSEAYLKRKTIHELIEKIQPHVPFLIESLDFSDTLKDFEKGKLDRLSLVLSQNGERFSLEGPLDIVWEKDQPADHAKLIHVHYKPVGHLTGPIHADPIALDLMIELPRSLESVSSFAVHLQTKDLAAPSNTKLSGFQVDGHWDNGKIAAQATAQSIAWADPGNSQHAVQVTDFQANIDGELDGSPLALRHQLNLGVAFKSAEVLKDDLYLDLPRNRLQFEIALSDSTSSSLMDRISQIQITDLLDGLSGKIELAVLPQAHSAYQLRWKLKDIPVARLAKFAATLPGLSKIGEFDWKAGLIQSAGSVEYRKPPPHLTKAEEEKEHAFSHWTGNLRLQDVRVRNDAMRLAIRGLNATLPLSVIEGEGEIQLKIAILGLLRYRGSLAQTAIQIARHPELEISTSALPLQIQGVPLHWGAIAWKKTTDDFEFTTSLKLDPVELSAFQSGACLDKKRLPPANFQADYPKITVRSDVIDPRGELKVDFFNGKITLGNLIFFDPFAAVMESDFDLNWSGIRLDQVGDWLNFGQMDATLEGHATKMTFQSWFPTRYDFLIQVKPFRHSWIVFSPDAMKNFVKLFAGQDLDEIPGIASWLAFGWPSRVFGGYDIAYLGFSLFSHDGSILMETLDPPDIFAKEQKHYILYGPRFKMPLNTPHYPLVTDATAMGNFVRQVSDELDTMAKNKKENAPHVDTIETVPLCLPADDL